MQKTERKMMNGIAAQSLYLLLVITRLQHYGTAYYLPGVNAKSFKQNDDVKLKVNKVTSAKTLLPKEYYHLPFCPPKGGRPVKDHENFGELLQGDRIENSPYTLSFMAEVYCKQVCVTNLGRGEHKGSRPSKMAWAIQEHYLNNWIVDNLDSAYKRPGGTSFAHGFPIGFVHKDGAAYVNNHVNIKIKYHAVDEKANEYNIVFFEVEPLSIRHDFEPTENAQGESVVTFINPIASCNPDTNPPQHTSYEMIADLVPQVAAGKVLFTYDVTWEEDTTVRWANRWDVYLKMDNPAGGTVQWLGIGRKMVIVLVLSAMVAAILTRNLRRDISKYNRLPVTDEERAEALEEFGWKLVHGDVFRPPVNAPMLLAVFSGTGAQLLSMLFPTIFFAALGFMNPSRRGRLIVAQLLLFVLAGGVAGYVSARLYKTFKGKSWYMNTILTALLFPGIVFGVFFVIDIVAASQGSSDAVPFWTIALLLFLWLGFATPLVFVGAYVGYTRDAIDFPVGTSGIPRQIPDQPFFMWFPCTVVICGIVPYGSCVLELHQILAAVWQDQYYYVFAFLLVVFCILLITSAEITVLFCYFQLCSEDHHWWWRSFANGGGSALWVILYGVSYFRSLETNSFAAYVLYFGYMAVGCIGLFLTTGFVGLYTSLWFNKTIFASIKID